MGRIQSVDIDQKYYCSEYHDVSVNKHCVKCETSLKFWENKGWINEIDLLDTDWVEDQKMMRCKLIDRKKNVSRFRGKLVRMIKDPGSKFDDYSISLKIDKFYCIGVMK